MGGKFGIGEKGAIFVQGGQLGRLASHHGRWTLGSPGGKPKALVGGGGGGGCVGGGGVGGGGGGVFLWGAWVWGWGVWWLITGKGRQ